jgi:uncharacterized ion transporter superfamily protein YfcC
VSFSSSGFVLLVPLALGYDRLVAAAIAYVLRYARRVQADGTRSIVGVSEEDATSARALVTDVPRLTRRQTVVIVLFGATFLIMTYGFIPWNDIWNETFGNDFPLPTFADFYFPEAATLFLVMAVVIVLIARLGEEGTVTTIIAGASDFLGAGLIIVNIPIAFLVPSSSGHAALVMPILAPLADFAGVSRAIAVTCFQCASGLVNILTPTSAVIMGGLALSKVGYDRYLKFVWPFAVGVFVIVCVFVGVAAAVGWSRPVATSSRPSATSGTTATMSSPSPPVSSSPTSGTRPPTPSWPKRGSRCLRSPARSSAGAEVGATA